MVCRSCCVWLNLLQFLIFRTLLSLIVSQSAAENGTPLDLEAPENIKRIYTIEQWHRSVAKHDIFVLGFIPVLGAFEHNQSSGKTLLENTTWLVSQAVQDAVTELDVMAAAVSVAHPTVGVFVTPCEVFQNRNTGGNVNNATYHTSVDINDELDQAPMSEKYSTAQSKGHLDLCGRFDFVFSEGSNHDTSTVSHDVAVRIWDDDGVQHAFPHTESHPGVHHARITGGALLRFVKQLQIPPITILADLPAFVNSTDGRSFRKDVRIIEFVDLDSGTGLLDGNRDGEDALLEISAIAEVAQLRHPRFAGVGFHVVSHDAVWTSQQCTLGIMVCQLLCTTSTVTMFLNRISY